MKQPFFKGGREEHEIEKSEVIIVDSFVAIVRFGG
jgi:hypothetical protein